MVESVESAGTAKKSLSSLALDDADVVVEVDNIHSKNSIYSSLTEALLTMFTSTMQSSSQAVSEKRSSAVTAMVEPVDNGGGNDSPDAVLL